jgi:hypothetical protein
MNLAKIKLILVIAGRQVLKDVFSDKMRYVVQKYIGKKN